MAVAKMPVLFVGHGSPMNAIEDNEFTATWADLGRRLPRPEAILAVSAHWYTAGSRINDAAAPRMVYDMYGFPEALYRLVYGAPGVPALAGRARALIREPLVVDNSWGLDHGAWSVLCRMYPAADIPVCQLSVDGRAPAETHLQIGRQLAALRREGVLVLGSGNVVHNLRRLDWGLTGGYPWAVEFDGWVKERIAARDLAAVADWHSAGPSADLAFPTPDHYFPLLYALGASDGDDRLTVFNEACLMGAMSMTGYLFE